MTGRDLGAIGSEGEVGVGTNVSGDFLSLVLKNQGLVRLQCGIVSRSQTCCKVMTRVGVAGVTCAVPGEDGGSAPSGCARAQVRRECCFLLSVGRERRHECS